jgi:serine/threonine protein kinase
VTGKTMAMKKIDLRREDSGVPTTALREISLLRALSNHPNIVKLEHVVLYNQTLHLVMEFLDCDLKHYLDEKKRARKLLSPLEVKVFVYQILHGLAYCHTRKVLHRDLKPQNLLLKDGQIKLADFGLAREFNTRGNPYTHEVVTLWYRAPEVLLGCDHYGTAVDIWSVGTIFAELATCQPLFPSDCEIDLLFKMFQTLGTPTEQTLPGVTSFKYYKQCFPKWSTGNTLRQRVPEQCLDPIGFDLLTKMLIYDPSQRISALEALEHEYFHSLPFVQQQ